MSEDVPLTAFEGGDGSDSDESGDEEPAGGVTADETAETPSFTYTSSPDGAPCAACGGSVEKRWRAGEGGVSGDENGGGGDDPDALVCSDCKEW